MNSLVGQTVGPYRIIESLGRGGMAVVYKAYQPGLDRYVALKVLPAHLADEPAFAERFKREARAVARLEHPHILPVYDYGQEGDLAYIAMRYVEGGTLKTLLGKPLELALTVNLITQIGEALDHAHEHGVIHRDVKPSNVLLDEGNWALLTDFGVARMVEATQQLTATGVGVGTPAYMSPEQGQGKQVDRRSDVYSLGVVLYEMLTGKVPFEAETPLAVVWKHANEPLPLPRSLNPEIPEAVERVVLKALAKSSEDRFQTAEELAKGLVAQIPEHRISRTQAEEGFRPTSRDRLVSQVRGRAFSARKLRKPALLSLGALFVLVAVMVAAGVLHLVIPTSGQALPGYRELTELTSASASPEAKVTPASTSDSVTSTAVPEVVLSAGTILFEEDFEGPAVRGIGFSAEPGWRFAKDMTGNRVYEMDNRGGSGYRSFSFGADEWQDYSVEFRGRMLSSSGTAPEIGLLFRNYGDSYYVLDLGEEALYLAYSVAGGEWTPFITQFPRIQRSVWYRVRVDVQGEKIGVYLDDAQVINARSSVSRRGWVLVFAGPRTYAQVDEIRVTQLEP